VLGLFAGPALSWGSRRAQRVLSFSAFALAATTLLYLVLKLLPSFDQQAWVPYALYAPINLGFAAAHYLWKKRPS
jgi:hypothetical protein